MRQKAGFNIFFIIWLGDFISTVGSGLTAFSLGIYVFQLTGKATTTALVVLCAFLPAFLLRPIGGIYADRVDRLLLMVFGNLGAALGVALIFVAMTFGTYNLIIIYLGVAFSSLFFAFQNPAYKASVSDFLPQQRYAKASGLMQLSNTAQFLIAPLLGGILLSIMDIKYVLLIDMLTFILSMISVVFVRFALNVKLTTTKREKNNFLKDMKAGFKTITENRGILLLISLTSLLLFYIGLYQVLLTPMVLSFTTAVNLGFAQSICAVGMLITSFTISVTERKRKNTFILSTSLGIMGVSFSGIGLTENIWSIIIPGFLFFLVIPYVNSSIDVLIRRNIANENQGRVWSLISVITYVGSLVAYATGGFLADKVFNPLFMPSGALANSLGHIFGVGKGRGISFIFFISGILVVFLSYFVFRSQHIWKLDEGEPLGSTIIGKERYES